MAKGQFMTVASLMEYGIHLVKQLIFELRVPQKQIFLLKPQNRVSFDRYTLFILW